MEQFSDTLLPDRLMEAMMEGQTVHVRTATRDFSGTLIGLYMGPNDTLAATVCDDEGRVHNYRPLRTDAITQFPY